MKRHWTLRYIYRRFSDFWDQRLHPDEPWLNPKIREALNSLLTSTDVMVECGSGRSTLWFARRVGKLLSIEFDHAWFARVGARLREAGMSNVELRFVQYSLNGDQQHNEYIDTLKSLSDESIDVALIDGGPRSYCAVALIPKLRPGGLLVIDDVHNFVPSQSETPNAIRTPAQIPTSYLGHVSLNWPDVYDRIHLWRRLWLSNGVRDTAIFFKPCY
jgi:hypothetical protein